MKSKLLAFFALAVVSSFSLVSVPKAHALTVCPGQPITLSWSSSNATTCSGTVISGDNACIFHPTADISGSQSITPTTCSVSLSCSGAGGSATASDSLTLDSSKVWNGSSCVTAAAGCSSGTQNNCVLSSVGSGSSSGTCAAGYTNGSCNYSCTNGSWSSNWNSCAVPSAGTPSCTLTASPTQITSGNSSTLSWTTTNGNSFSIDNGIGNVTPVSSGTNKTVSPSTTTTYYGTVTGASGATAQCAATVTVSAALMPDLIVSSDAASSPSSPIVNSSATLSATIRNSGNATASGTFPNIIQVDNDSDHSTYTTLATNSVSNLAANGTAPISASYTFPAAGTYYLRACADENASWVGSVVESNENNNCGNWVSITVGGAQCPATTIGGVCPLTAASSGTSENVSCGSGYSGNCNYTCNNGSWSGSNSCVCVNAANNPPACNTCNTTSGFIWNPSTNMCVFSTPTLSISASFNPLTKNATVTWSTMNVSSCTVTATTYDTNGNPSSSPMSNDSSNTTGMSYPVGASSVTFTLTCTDLSGVSTSKSTQVSAPGQTKTF